MNTNKAWIGMGSNMGDRLANLQEAVDRLEQPHCRVLRVSSVYETEPVGFDTDSFFLNAVAEVEWEGSAAGLMQHLLTIETVMGRTRSETERYTSRPIDLDILLLEKEVINNTDLVIPHPRMQERNFVLVPLNELIPGYLHPVLNQTVTDLRNQCVDENGVFIHDKALSVNR